MRIGDRALPAAAAVTARELDAAAGMLGLPGLRVLPVAELDGAGAGVGGDHAGRGKAPVVRGSR